MNDRSDQQLLQDYAQNRSDTAFAELVRRHVDLVYSAALRRLGDSHLAEDVAQGTFTALAQNARSLAGHPVLSGWLHRTTQNIAANLIRTNLRRQIREQEAVTMNQLLSSAPDDANWQSIAPHLDAALDELESTDRDVVLLRYFEKKSARETAAQLGISEDAAQKRVSRAVERLREFFAKRGVTVGASGLAVVISANAVQAAPVGLTLTITTATALVGTTLATTATVTATKAIAMTALQKIIVAATIAGLAGAGIYEARQASQLREQNQTLQQQQAPLTEENDRLQRERNDLTNRFAALSDEIMRGKSNSAELLKLRGEIGLLRRLNQQSLPANALPDAKPTQTLEKGFGSLGDYLSADMVSDAGTSTPEALLQTFIWAIREGKANRLEEIASMFGGQSEPGDVVGQISESQAPVFKMIQSAFTSASGFRLSSKSIGVGQKYHVRLEADPINGSQNNESPKNLNLTFVLERKTDGWTFGDPSEITEAK